MIENLYELVGGHEVIKEATDCFYQKVLEDENLRHFFGQADIASLRPRQLMFITMLLGGGVYTGKDVSVAHAQARADGLDHRHFDLFMTHFRAALEEVGVKPDNAEKIMKLLERKRKSILEA